MLRAGVVLALLVLATPARAEDPVAQARRLGATATEAGKARDYARAARLFREAYALDPRAEYVCNVGVAYLKGGDLPRAHLYLETCRSRDSQLPDDYRTLVDKTIHDVEAQLRDGDYALVELRVSPATAEVRHDPDTFVGSRDVWLPLGSHELVVAAPGYQRQLVQVDLTGREPVAIRVDLLAEPPPAPEVEPAPQRPPPLPPGHTAFQAGSSPPSKGPAVVAGVVTLTSLSVALALHAEASVSRDGGDSTRDQAYLMDVITVAAAITTVVLWNRKSSPPPLAVSASGSGASVWWRTRF